MMVKSTQRVILGAIAFVAVSVFGAENLAAQVATTDAQAFLGDWEIVVEGDQPATFQVNITDTDGQVAAEVTGVEGNKFQVERITKSDENLVLNYTSHIGGMDIPIVITVHPEGEELRGNIDLAGMQTSAIRATKRES